MIKETFPRKIISLRSLSGFFTTLLLLLVTSSSIADEAVQIAHSSSPIATAFNNSRKIARTSFDRRVVVYQDSLEQRPVVMWAYSDDGLNWSNPAILAYGSLPSLTVAENDRIYGCWINEDSESIAVSFLEPASDNWANNDLPRLITIENMTEINYPGIEVTGHSVHLIWQAKDQSDGLFHIYSQTFDNELSQSMSNQFRLNLNGGNSIFPTIAGDLEFDIDLTLIFWTTNDYSQQTNYIGYGSIFEKITEGTSSIMLGLGQSAPLTDVNIQSVSVRGYQLDDFFSANLVLAYTTKDQNLFITSLAEITSEGMQIIDSDTIITNQDPMPTVDDVHIRSCAICWVDNGTIYYGQNTDGKFHASSMPVSEENVSANYPNVCYKTFRWDIFDVVWTEGDVPPYRVMYRRMNKSYQQSVNDKGALQSLPHNLEILPNFPNPFNLSTTIPIQVLKSAKTEIGIYDLRGKLVKKLHTGSVSAGRLELIWDGKNQQGDIVGSGLYFVRLHTDSERISRKMILLK